MVDAMKRKLSCVVLVDDNESDNFLHSRLLKKAAITENIEIVLNGKEALALLAAKKEDDATGKSHSRPELVFLDINMPVMDGWEFLEEYQHLGTITGKKPVFIILTTSLNPVDKIKAEKLLNSGCFYFKPMTLTMISEILEHHFPEYL